MVGKPKPTCGTQGKPSCNKIPSAHCSSLIYYQSKDPSAKSTDPTGQKKVVRVAIELQNQDSKLRDGSTGYARIYSKGMNWHQRIWRDLENIIGFERV